jgi:hypothetical protein
MPPLRELGSQTSANCCRSKTFSTAASLAIRREAGSLAITSPLGVKPRMTIRCPLVLYPALSNWFFLNATETTSGIPALMNCSASVSERNCTTCPSSPNEPAYAVLNGQLPAPL